MTNFRNAMMAAAHTASGVPIVSVGNSALYTTSSQELERTPSSTGNVDKFTFSTWVYLCNPTSGTTPIFGAINTGANQQRVFTNSDGTLQFDLYLSNSYVGRLITTQVLKDIGWYHIVAVYDSGNGIAGNRQILYLNGVRITDLATAEYVSSQNQDGLICGANLHQIGMHDGLGVSMDGYMAEAVLLDGTVADPSSFGEFDSTGTYWTPKSSDEIKALTFGTNGFYLDNTTNAQTDASGTGNNFTNTGSVTLSTHTPTNIFNLWNPLFGNSATAITLTNGNQTAAQASASDPPRNIFSTIPLIAEDSSGFYAEITCTNVTDLNCLGIVTAKDPAFNFGSNEYYLYDSTGGKRSTGNTQASYGNSYTDGDVIGICVKNGKIYFSKNGTFQNSGDPSTGTESGFAFENISGPFVIMFSGGGSGTPYTITLNSGQSSYSATPPTGTRKIDTTAIASATTRTKSNLEEYFSTTLYEGNGAGQRVGKFLPFTDTFTVGNSALFNRNNSESLSKTPSGAGSSTTTGTFNVWIKQGSSIANRGPLIYVDGSGSDFQVELNISGNNKLRVDLSYSSANHVKLSTQAFKDTSQWSMVTCILDTSNGTASERIRLYWNSNRLALTTDNTIDQNQAIIIGSAVEHQIGALETSYFYDGYMSEVVYIDGTALEPSNFGQVDTSTGRWIPKDVSGLTFGTNGFYLNFAASGDVGNDVSGNNNDFTNNNTVVQVGDTPTTNFATLNVSGGATTVTNGNRTNTGASGGYGHVRTSLTFGNEKIFAMLLINDGGSGASVNTGFSVAPDSYIPSVGNAGGTGAYANIQTYGTITRVVIGDAKGGTVLVLTHSIAVADGDYFTMAVDAANGAVWFGIYDTSAGSHQYLPAVVGGTAGDPANGTLPTVSNLPFNNSQSCIFSTGFGTSSSSTIVFNSADMPMSLPTDYLEFKQDNLTEGESYQTAFSWIKNRDASDNHMLFDRVRGIYKDIHANDMIAQVTNVNTLQRFLNGGVQVGNDVEVNTANESYVAWNWYMETTGSGTSNTDGTINTTATLVDTNLGLSISQYTGTGSNATIGHGLGVVPEVILLKNLDNTGSTQWLVYHSAVGNTKAGTLDSNFAFLASAGYFNNTTPTSSVFSVGNSTYGNESSKNHVAYCFAPSQFISIGSYIGNGNANGTFVPTVNSLGVPIQPAWFLTKNTTEAESWNLQDTARHPYNEVDISLFSNSTATDTAGYDKDFVTGGFKMRTTNAGVNKSGITYVYLAFGTPLIDVDGRIIGGR